VKRRWKVLIGVLVALAVVLALNTIAVNNETTSAGVNVEGGQILELTGGDVQVKEDGPADGPPIVLLHGFSGSIRWWDGMVDELAREHRVIRFDLLGHGGSEKPSGGYSMEEQARLVALALNELGVEGATVAGHSMGATVAVALAEEASELVDKIVVVDEGPDNTYADVPFLAKLGFVPVIGQALNRLVTDGMIRDGFEDSTFAPGYDLADGFEDPDQVIEDFRAMTYTAFDQSASAEDDYSGETPLDQRLISAAVPVLVIFGSEDQSYDADENLTAYQDVPGVRTAKIEGAGHSPNVEKPAETARLILEFAGDPGDARPGSSGPRRPQDRPLP
jgi:pimeloyl-ACP methyl ester carboxylesterase